MKSNLNEYESETRSSTGGLHEARTSACSGLTLDRSSVIRSCSLLPRHLTGCLKAFCWVEEQCCLAPADQVSNDSTTKTTSDKNMFGGGRRWSPHRACKCYVTAWSKCIATRSNLQIWFETNLASYLLCMEPCRESTDGSNTSPASTLLSSYSQVFSVFFLQVQIPCYILSSCATSQVHRAVSPTVVPVQHCCLEEDPLRPSISFSWAVFCVVDFFIAHSSVSLDRENARNNETKTSSSYFDVEWLPCSLVRGRISAPVHRRLHDRKQPHTPHKSCPTPIICSIMSQ